MTMTAASSSSTPGTGKLSLSQQLKATNLELLGERIRRARQDLKISQRDLCEGLFTSAYLSSLELGKTRPTLNTLEQLAARLGKSVEYFLRQPSGSVSSESALTFDQEHARFLELRNYLLQAEVALAGQAFDTARHQLDRLKAFLGRLPAYDQALYFILQGRLANSQDDYELALDSLHRAQQLLAGEQNDMNARLEYELGQLNYNQRQLIAALAHFQAALAMPPVQYATASGFKIQLLAGAARCLIGLNEVAKASEYINQALELSQPANLGSVINSYLEQATRLTEQNDFQQAGFLLGQSHHLAEQNGRRGLLLELSLELSQLLVQSKDFDTARPLTRMAYNLSLAAGSNVAGHQQACAEVNALCLMALLSQHDADAANGRFYLAQAQKALDEKRCPDAMTEARFYHAAAVLETNQERKKEAAGFYRRAIKQLEEEESARNQPAANRMLADIYFSYGQLLKEIGQHEEAFIYAEKAYQISSTF